MAKSKKRKKPPNRPAKIVRAERALRDLEAIRDLREHFTGYEAKDGYSLKVSAVEKLPYHKRRAIRGKHKRLAVLLGTPRVAVAPADKAEAKVLRKETGQRFRGAKHFLVSVPDAERSKVSIEQGQVKITTHLPGKAEVEEMYFRIPHRPKTPEDLVQMTLAMLPDMPKTGTYYIVTTAGEFGYTVDHGQLETELRETLETYDNEKYGANRYLFQVLGFRWVRNKLADKIITQHRSQARAARRKANRQRAEQLRKQAARAAKKG